jgi:bifunctional DNase/RNase
MELVPISFKKIMQSRAYTVIILGNDTKQFAIYTEPFVGKNLQILLTQERHPRPFTHDLMNAIFEGFEIRLLQVVINNIEDTIYFSRLFLEQQIGDQKQILEIDARPSDCLTFAVKHGAPLYCNKEVFDKTVPIKD